MKISGVLKADYIIPKDIRELRLPLPDVYQEIYYIIPKDIRELRPNIPLMKISSIISYQKI